MLAQSTLRTQYERGPEGEGTSRKCK